MTFLKQNWFKIIIAIGIMSVVFYLAIFLPQQATKKECAVIATKQVDDGSQSKEIRLYPPTGYKTYYEQCLKEKGSNLFK